MRVRVTHILERLLISLDDIEKNLLAVRPGKKIACFLEHEKLFARASYSSRDRKTGRTTVTCCRCAQFGSHFWRAVNERSVNAENSKGEPAGIERFLGIVLATFEKIGQKRIRFF